MVKKATSRKASGKKASAKKGAAKKGASGAAKAGLPERIIEAAFALAVEQGWRDLSLAEIAEAAALPLSEVHPVFPSKQAILSGFFRQVDAAMLAEGGADMELPARDRLFDMIMRRFDALQPHKEALGVILHQQMGDPLAACCGLHRLRRAMAATLEAAGFSTTGCRGLLRIKGLSAIYLSTLRVWLRDDSEDMAKTMAHLDQQLSRIDSLIGRFNSYRPRGLRSGRAAA